MEKRKAVRWLAAAVSLVGLLFCMWEVWGKAAGQDSAEQREVLPVWNGEGAAGIRNTLTFRNAAGSQKTFETEKGSAVRNSSDEGNAFPKSRQEKKKICLTFDDGPHSLYTPQLLDGLKERSVKATFFLTGQSAAANPELVKRMAEEGHLIGNHTYHHVSLKEVGGDKFREEIVETNEVLEALTGRETEYIRPPYGIWDKRYEKELCMIPVMWNIDPLDWCRQDARKIARDVVKDAGENAVILMHDQYPSSVTAALFVVDTLKEQGYQFVTVDEILFD